MPPQQIVQPIQTRSKVEKTGLWLVGLGTGLFALGLLAGRLLSFDFNPANGFNTRAIISAAITSISSLVGAWMFFIGFVLLVIFLCMYPYRFAHKKEGPIFLTSKLVADLIITLGCIVSISPLLACFAFLCRANGSPDVAAIFMIYTIPPGALLILAGYIFLGVKKWKR